MSYYIIAPAPREDTVLLSTLIDAYSESRADRFEVWLGQTLKVSHSKYFIVLSFGADDVTLGFWCT